MTITVTDINAQLDAIFTELETITAEDEKSDDLVLQLLDTMQERQLLLQNLTDTQGASDKAFLQGQLKLSQDFLIRVKALQEHRQQLLQNSSRSKRQLNVYKTIDANR